MTDSNETTNPQHYVLTIQPGFPDYEEPIPRHVKRESFGPHMTVYTIDNEISALLAKKRLENEGYIIHMQRPDGTTSSTKHDVIYAGIKLSSN